ncbi:MAG: MFS transporter [Caulobacterales bacterium]|nr:MFS transporter [Caulobacterales bacterium]
MAPNTAKDVSLWRLAIYGLPALPWSFLFVPLTAMLPAFYSQSVGVSLAEIGMWLLISRFLDVLINPVLGRWSDITSTRFGRRKPWMFIAVPILMLGSWLVFMPPADADGIYLFWATSVIYLGAAILGLTHSAWGAELVESYHGRSKVAGFREGANVFGIIIASCVPAITATLGHGVDRFTMGAMGVTMMVLTPLTVVAAVAFVPEPRVPRQKPTPWLSTMASLMKNGPFRLICVAYTVLYTGASVANTTLIFFISHYLGQPELIGPVLLASFGCVLLGVPLWVMISRRIGKHRAAAISLIIAVCLSAILAMQLRPGDGWLFVALMGFLGITSSAFLTLPLGMVGDVIDYDTLRTGHSRGGLYFGVWSFFQNVSPALAIGITLPLLQNLGFNAQGENTPQALEALKLVYCFGPVPFFLAGALMFFVFPLDARRHGIIRRRLEARRARSASAGDSP